MVRAQAAGAIERTLDLTDARLVGCGTGKRTGLLGGSTASRNHVQAHDLHAGRDEKAHHELTDEAEPDHARGLTERDLRAADALHGIAPTVANAACSAATPSGTGTHRLVGTQFTSAWRANSLPAAATT